MLHHRWLVLAAAVAFALISAGAVHAELLSGLFGPRKQSSLVLSGNIEAHESVVNVKSVESRIVELPFDEGQWVTAGTLIARLDDSG